MQTYNLDLKNISIDQCFNIVLVLLSAYVFFILALFYIPIQYHNSMSL